MRTTLTVIALLLLGGAGTPTMAPSPARVYELAGGLWWTGGGFEERTMYSIGGVFDSERPTRVDSVIDLSGRFIVPPFAEAHTHTIAYVRTRIDEFLEQGVFYALVMNVHRSAIGRNFTWFGRPGSVDVNFTSAGVTAADGHPIQIGLRGDATIEDVDGDWVTIIETRQDIEDKWAALRDANPDLIKLFLLHSDRYAERHGDTTIATRYKGMDPSLVSPLVKRAHDAGLRVAAHVRTAHDFRVAVEAGVDIIAHLPGFSMQMSAFGEGGPGPDEEDPERFRIRPGDAALAAKREITVIPTIGSLGSVPDTLAPDVAARVRGFLDTRRETITDNLRLLGEHGVRIAIGSDAGEGSPVTEALVMHELGVFTEAELLNMLTEHAARVTFPRRSIGRLQDGYEASFLALGGDPTARLAHVRDIELRFKQGAPLILESPADSSSASAGP